MPRDKTTGEWICSKPGCDERRPEMFAKVSGGYCRPCTAQRDAEEQERIKRNPEKLAKKRAQRRKRRLAWEARQDRAEYLQRKRAESILHTHGLTLEQYDSLGNTCGICGKECYGSDRHLHHEHNLPWCNHSVKRTCGNCQVGILCSKHNKMLGLAGDDPEMLRAGLEFLERSKDQKRAA